MRSVCGRVWARIIDESGASLVEYAFILAVVLVVSVVIIGEIGGFPALAFDDANDGF